MSKETTDVWRTAAVWLVALLQAGLFYLLNDIRSTLHEQAVTLGRHSTALAVIEARHSAEDRKP